jgi:hypothetical protein
VVVVFVVKFDVADASFVDVDVTAVDAIEEVDEEDDEDEDIIVADIVVVLLELLALDELEVVVDTLVLLLAPLTVAWIALANFVAFFSLSPIIANPKAALVRTRICENDALPICAQSNRHILNNKRRLISFSLTTLFVLFTAENSSLQAEHL